MKKSKLVVLWLQSRQLTLLFFLAIYVILFVVYGLYGYAWGVAFYTALLITVAGLLFGLVDLLRFAAAHTALSRLPGRYPLNELPEERGLLTQEYNQAIRSLEAERIRLTSENERQLLDAQQYYTLWAHQIKTPIAAMRLLLQQEEGAEPNRTALEAELFSIEQYVGMVLQYQRLSSLHADLQLRCQPLEGLVKRSVKNLAPLFIRKKISLRLADIPGEVVTDEKWFVFVLEQLLTNALKYTQRGQVLVYMADSCCLVIEDTGIGILPEDLPRVFQRGFTGNTGRTDRRASGIGLYLCHEILAQLGFGIRIESTPGSGTKVLLDVTQPESWDE